MGKLKSSVPGMPYPPGRDHFLKTAFRFLEGRRRNDGAEGLWRIRDSLYNLEDFAKSHPGGSEWLTVTKGTDITEAFEVNHVSNKAELLLPKYYVGKATQKSRTLPYTFKPDGFYRKFKDRAYEALKNVDYHSPTLRSKLIADSLALITLASTVAAATFRSSWIFVILSGLFLSCTMAASHNFFHMRDNFRMYYFDLGVISSKNWRVSHVLSHHLYSNTAWDWEIYGLEPFLCYLPADDKSIIYRFVTVLLSPIVLCVAIFIQAAQRYYSVVMEWKKCEFRDAVPFVIPTLMILFTPTVFDAMKLWLWVLITASAMFHFVGLTAAHHHPEIFHDGDICRKEMDWGLAQLDAVRGRTVVDDSLFLALVSFGSHGLHHLLPTVDHGNLELCLPAFRQTCREFGVDTLKMSQWELIKGQYRQLVRTEPRANFRGGPDSGPVYCNDIF